MRILLDECIPRRLKDELVGHDTHTVPEMGWAGKKNGDLLNLLVPAGFEVFLTVDQNLRYEQNLHAASIVVVVLVAPTNRLADLKPLVPSVLKALAAVQPGQLIVITS